MGVSGHCCRRRRAGQPSVAARVAAPLSQHHTVQWTRHTFCCLMNPLLSQFSCFRYPVSLCVKNASLREGFLWKEKVLSKLWLRYHWNSQFTCQLLHTSSSSGCCSADLVASYCGWILQHSLAQKTNIQMKGNQEIPSKRCSFCHAFIWRHWKDCMLPIKRQWKACNLPILLQYGPVKGSRT